MNKRDLLGAVASNRKHQGNGRRDAHCILGVGAKRESHDAMFVVGVEICRPPSVLSMQS